MRRYMAVATWLVLWLGLLGWSVPAWSDSLVVPTCGQLPLAYAPGATRPETIDVNGIRCMVVSASLGSGAAGYPAGATPWVTDGLGTTAGANAFHSSVPKVTYLCSLSVSPGSATAAITLNIQLLANGSPAQQWWVGAPVTAAGTTGAIFSQTFTPCLSVLAPGGSWQATVGALGAGGVNQSVNMAGYDQ